MEGFPADIPTPGWEDRDWENNITTVDGQRKDRCFYISSNTTIDGITVTRGGGP